MDIAPDEQAVEQAVAQELKTEEVRAKIIEEFGFDEVDDAERIDKLVTKEMDSHKKLSTAIRQKIEWRTKAATAPKEEPAKPAIETKKGPEDIEKVVNSTIAKTLDQRDLESLDYPDEIKKDIQRIAQAQGISIKQAARDPYIVFKIDEHKKAEKAEEAAISRTNRSSGKKSYSLDNPPDVDMSTEEGRKEWDAYIEWAKKQ